MKHFCLCLLAGLFVMGCRTAPSERVLPPDAATIFYERATFPEKLQQDTGVPRESILAHGRCRLYLATPGATITTNYRFCTYALMEKRLLIQEWDVASAKYTQFMDVDFAQVVSVDLAFHRRNSQVKIVEPQRLTGISAIIDEGWHNDAEATEKMFLAIQAQGIPSTGDKRVLREPAVFVPTPVPIMVPIIVPRYHHHHYRHR